MAYLPIITAVISGLLVWVLGRWNTNREERKQEKKRLNRLLYNMLELKHWVDKEISAEPFVTKAMEQMCVTIKAIEPERTDAELSEMFTVIAAGIKRAIFKQPQLPRLEQNISEIVRDYSEIDPFFAYDLTGKYQLTENLELMKDYLNGVIPEDMELPDATAFMNQLMRPTFLGELQKDLIIHLPQIAGMIGPETLETVRKNHLNTKVPVNTADLERYCREMIPQLIAAANALAEQQPSENHLSLPDE
ncbi:hypothetical protein [Mucilaginibacter pedocola]|uniref:Uncharacterized protein n=1 Tax=Mucilaginibacter pedocola TaxID=1792845 RepID=A0A1S9PBW0_9SPHI|nr:hypothetical protein [Mucilaginibacter pedocola]OOQ58287.1 hypothetical protein BC343_11680 [Mucilaginibacter pedocola]